MADLPPLPDWVEALMPKPKTDEPPAEPHASPLVGQEHPAGPVLTPIKASSNIAAVGHDGSALYVQFHGGGLYRYPTAGADLHQAFLAAESAGKYFHQNIKPHHKGEKLS